MKKSILKFALFIMLSLSIGYCDNPKMYLPSTEEAGGLKISNTINVRSDTELFEYMNGGAELYRAFNFRKLSVRQFEISADDMLIVELYMFKKPADAYGMYLMLPEAEPVDIGNSGGYERGVVRFWKGRFFCKIFISDSNWDASKKALLNIGKIIADKIPDEGNKPDIVDLIPKQDLKNSGIHYFYDYIALKNLLYITYTNILNLSGETEAVLAEYSSIKAEEVELLLVKYPSNEECFTAYNNMRIDFLKEPVVDKSNNNYRNDKVD